MTNRVIVTGIGIITALGDSIESIWTALLNGRSGIGYFQNGLQDLGIKGGGVAYHIPVNSTKSMIGHTFAASGSIESAVCIMSLQFRFWRYQYQYHSIKI